MAFIHSPLAAVPFVAAATVAILAQAGQEPRPVFRSGVALVRLDVKVVDANGTPITDLRADEVQIVEGAVPRPVVLFQKVEGAGANYTEAARRVVAGDVSTNEGAPQGRLYVLVFDQDHIRAGGEQPVRTAADAFLRQHVRPQDRVAVFGLPGPGPAQAFTANVASAREQLKQVRGGLERRVQGSVVEMSIHEAYEIMRGNEVVMARFTTTSNSGTGVGATSESILELARAAGGDASVLRRLVRENAQTVVAQADSESRNFLRAFADLLRSFKGIDGRKTVVLMSDGFHADNVGRELEVVAAAAAETYSVVHAFDLNRRSDVIASGASMQDESSEITSRVEPMGSLTAETSGMLLKDAGSRLEASLATLLPDETGYYLIGFAPAPEASDGAYRRVKVSTSRRGARVITRTGYASAAPTAATGIKQAMERALSAPFTQQGLRLEYTTYVGQSTAPGLQRVVVSLKTELPVRQREGTAATDVADVMFVVRNSRTGQVAARGTDNLALPEHPVEGRSTGETAWRVAFELPAGDYIMRCAVREPGGVVGSADRRFTVAALSGQGIAATDLIVTSPTDTLPVRAQLYTEGALTAMLRLFGPSAEALQAATARLDLTPVSATESQRTGRVTEGVLGEPTVTGGRTMRDVAFHLPLERLAPGTYTAHVTVRVGEMTVADLRRSVEVVAGAPPTAAASATKVRARDVLDGEVAQRLLRGTIAGAPERHARAAANARTRQWEAVLTAVGSPAADDLVGLQLRGLAALGAEQYSDAASALAAAFRAKPDDADLAFVLGWAHVGAGNPPAAISAFRNAANLAPTMIAAHLALVEAYLAGGHRELALQAVEAGLRAVPQSVELLRLQGVLRKM